MIVYWSFLCSSLMALFFAWFSGENDSKKGFFTNEFIALPVYGYMLFMIALRSGVGDTRAYIYLFEKMPSSLSGIIPYMEENTKDPLFFLTSSLFKCLINNWQIWLALIAMMSGMLLFKTLKRYSVNLSFSVFLLIASTDFTWMMNGIRQFVAVVLIFYFSKYLFNNNKMKMLLVIILASMIHISSVIFIVALLLDRDKIFSKKMVFIFMITIVSTILIQPIISVVDNLSVNSTYGYVVDFFEEDDGTNIIRVIISMVPVILAFIKKSQISGMNDKKINLYINLSVLSVCVHIVSTVTSGIFIGRLTIFFSIYNLLLMPWLFKTVYRGAEKVMLYYMCISCYIVFFYYQMVIAWQGLKYISDILNLYL